MTSSPLSADTAYREALNLQLEAEELMRLRRTGRIADREFLLRQAALFDRQTLAADPDDGKAQTSVLRSADKLRAFDAANGTSCGPIGPDDNHWATNPRGYVRQEYLAWQEGQDADRAQIFPSRGPDGELYQDGRPL